MGEIKVDWGEEKWEREHVRQYSNQRRSQYVLREKKIQQFQKVGEVTVIRTKATMVLQVLLEHKKYKEHLDHLVLLFYH